MIQRSISYDPSRNVQPAKAVMHTPNLQTIDSHNAEEEMNQRNLREAPQEQPVTVAKVAETNHSSKSSIVKLRSPGGMLPNSEDEESMALGDKNILENVHHSQSEYAISSSDARSTNADTGFVSLSESSGKFLLPNLWLSLIKSKSVCFGS